MPFTVSHAAAIIPFYRKPLILSALIVGSMSPDFLYYMPFIPNYHVTHTVQGLFLFCLPISLVLLLVYHQLIKHPLISILPWQVHGRLSQSINTFEFLPTSKLLWIVCSILLGALTHLVWDSFTHETGQAVLFFSLLTQPIFSVAGETIFLYKLLQYFSTVVGGLVFAAWIMWRVWRDEPNDLSQSHSNKTSKPWIFLMILISCVIGLVYGWSFYNQAFKVFVVQTVIGSMNSFFVLLVLFSLAWYMRTLFSIALGGIVVSLVYALIVIGNWVIWTKIDFGMSGSIASSPMVKYWTAPYGLIPAIVGILAAVLLVMGKQFARVSGICYGISALLTFFFLTFTGIGDYWLRAILLGLLLSAGYATLSYLSLSFQNPYSK